MHRLLPPCHFNNASHYFGGPWTHARYREGGLPLTASTLERTQPMSAIGGKADIVSDPTFTSTPIIPGTRKRCREVRQDWFRKLQKFCELSWARSTLTNFGPHPLIPTSARIPAAARLRAGARLGLPDHWWSSQHLIVRIHARSITRAQTLPVVRQMRTGLTIKRWLVQSNPAGPTLTFYQKPQWSSSET